MIPRMKHIQRRKVLGFREAVQNYLNLGGIIALVSSRSSNIEELVNSQFQHLL